MTGRPLSARLQLLFYGLIPRLHHDNSLNMTCASFRAKLATVEHIVLPPLLENVLLPATARTQTDALHFNAVDVYGHTWRLAQEPCTDFSQDEMLQTTVERGLVAPQVKTRSIVLEFGQATSNYHPRVQWALTTYAYLNALVSIERAIKLLPLHSVSPVLLMRWDTIFLTRMHLSTLNWQLFYRVNFCMTSGPASGNGVVVGGSRAPHPNRCEPLQFFGDITCRPGQGTGDYWFAGNLTAMILVFEGALTDYALGLYKPQLCGVLHGVIEGRIRYISRRDGLEVGRYGYHGMDNTFARLSPHNQTSPYCRGSPALKREQFTLSDHLWLEHDGNGTLAYTYPVHEPRVESVCPASIHWCGCSANAINELVHWHAKHSQS